jgi:hypothetical protein
VQLCPQVNRGGLGAGIRPVLLAQDFHGGQYRLENVQFAFAKLGARPGFAQGDIDKALVADREQVPALILVATVAVPGLVVLAVPETGGGEIPQAEPTAGINPARCWLNWARMGI